MKNIFIILFLLLLFTSCAKINSSKTPTIPDIDSLDINNDLRFDFVIEYSQNATTDIPSSQQNITGELRPLDNNQVLYSQTMGHLFLKANDTIRSENSINSNWSDYPASLIGINGKNSNWDKDWKVISHIYPDFFIGIKLNGETEQIGWILLNLDTKSGQISIKDKELTNSPELIIIK